LLLEPGNVRQHVLPDGAPREGHPIAFRDQHVDQLPPARHDGLQIGLLTVGERPHRGLDPGGKLGEHASIDAVGFFQPAEGLGEVAHLPRIDDRHREPGGRERTRGPRFIAPGSFEHNDSRLKRAHPLDQRGPPVLVVGRLPPRGQIGRPGDIQRGLRHVDAHRTLFGHGTPSVRSVDGARSALRMRVEVDLPFEL
jgi:hypothetical protein